MCRGNPLFWASRWPRTGLAPLRHHAHCTTVTQDTRGAATWNSLLSVRGRGRGEGARLQTSRTRLRKHCKGEGVSIPCGKRRETRCARRWRRPFPAVAKAHASASAPCCKTACATDPHLQPPRSNPTQSAKAPVKTDDKKQRRPNSARWGACAWAGKLATTPAPLRPDGVVFTGAFGQEVHSMVAWCLQTPATCRDSRASTSEEHE